MTASEARQKAREIVDAKAAKQYITIKTEIGNAVAKGEFEINFYDAVLPEVRIKLEADGFQVGETFTHQNDHSTKIGW